MKGPDFLNNLIGVLIRFRTGRIAATSDIEQMFHQIRVRNTDQDALRFVWRNTEFDNLDDYAMCVHLFGKLDSPCIANYILKRTATDNKSNFHQDIIDSVHNNFYMDDYLGSYDSIVSATETVTNITTLLEKGGFRLTKWLSNSSTLIDSIPVSERAKPIPSKSIMVNNFSIDTKEKILRIM